MNIDTTALKSLAALHNVEPDEAIRAVEAALDLAYHATPDADPAARVNLAADGTLTVLSGTGTLMPVPGFGHVATAAARQAVIAWVKDLERRKAVGPWAAREGRIVEAAVTGEGRNGELRLLVDGVLGVLPAGEQVLTEQLVRGTRVPVLLLAANVDNNGAIRLSLSRRQPALIERLIVDACPEVRNGQVSVVGVVREPGVRAKVALASAEENLDPVAAVVGAGGHRMRQVMAALGAERVDLVRHDTDLARFAAAALSPARTVDAVVLDEARRKVQVVVGAEELAAAEGADGLNLKLANRLTRTKIVLALAD